MDKRTQNTDMHEPLNKTTDLLSNIQNQAMTAMSNLTSVSETWSAENSWGQPFPNARGTIMGQSNYTRENAKEDAMRLRKAMKGLGTDKATIVDITGHRNFEQRLMIVKEYVNVDEKEKRDLLYDFKNDVGGDLGNLVLPLYMMPGEFDARLMEKAMRGIGNDVEVLNEILCTRTNKEIQEMKLAWIQKIDEKQKLEDRVATETKKFFGITHYHTLCVKLLEARRPPCITPDEKQVRADAEELNHLLTERSQNAEAKFVEIFTERSWPHIRALVGVFQNVSEKWTLDGAICHEFGESSNTVKALRLLIEFCTDPYDFWAKRLRDSLKGIGTDDSKLIRIIVNRCEIDLGNIVETFGQRYGESKNLKNWIEHDASGFYAQLLLYLCGYN
jgi:hypothetical protein